MGQHPLGDRRTGSAPGGGRRPPRERLQGQPGRGAHPAVDDHHVLRVAVQPGLLGLADGAHLVQRRRVQLGPAHVQDLRGHGPSAPTPARGQGTPGGLLRRFRSRAQTRPRGPGAETGGHSPPGDFCAQSHRPPRAGCGSRKGSRGRARPGARSPVLPSQTRPHLGHSSDLSPGPRHRQPLGGPCWGHRRPWGEGRLPARSSGGRTVAVQHQPVLSHFPFPLIRGGVGVGGQGDRVLSYYKSTTNRVKGWKVPENLREAEVTLRAQRTVVTAPQASGTRSQPSHSCRPPPSCRCPPANGRLPLRPDCWGRGQEGAPGGDSTRARRWRARGREPQARHGRARAQEGEGARGPRSALAAQGAPAGGDRPRAPGVSLQYFHNFLCIYGDSKLKKFGLKRNPGTRTVPDARGHGDVGAPGPASL